SALAAAGCQTFFVASLDEAIALRVALGERSEIAVLNGLLPGTAPDFVHHRLFPILNDPGQIEDWGRCGQERAAFLHVDTGMSRLGLSAREFNAFIETPTPVHWRAVMSHLACADEAGHELNELQRDRFANAAAQFPDIPASLSASSGIFLGRPYHFDLARPG